MDERLGSMRELTSQEEIDHLFESLKKSQLKSPEEIDLLKEAVKKNTGKKENENKKQAKREKNLLLKKCPLIKRRLIDPFKSIMLRTLEQHFTNISIEFMGQDISTPVEGPLLIDKTFESFTPSLDFLTREFSYKKKYLKFSLSLGQFGNKSTLEIILSNLGQEFNKLVNRKMIFGSVFSHCSKDLFNIKFSDNYFTPIIISSFSISYKNKKNTLFLILPIDFINQFLKKDEPHL